MYIAEASSQHPAKLDQLDEEPILAVGRKIFSLPNRQDSALLYFLNACTRVNDLTLEK